MKMGERMTYRGKRKSHRGLNTRNVRNSALKQREKNKMLEFFRAELEVIITSLAQNWVKLPSFHRKSISVVFILWVVVIIWSPKEDVEKDIEKPKDVVILPLRHIENRPFSDMDLGLVNEELGSDSFNYDDSEMELAFVDNNDSLEPQNYRKVPVTQVRHLQTQASYEDAHKEEYKEKIIPIKKVKYVEEVIEEDEEIVPIEPVSTSQYFAGKWRDYRVIRGDNMTKIFRKNKFKLSDLYAILAIEGKDKPLTRLRPKQNLRFLVSNKGKLDVLEIEVAGQDPTTFIRNENGKFERVY